MRLQRQKGLSLVELMVSLTIGLILIGGALFVYVESQETAKVNESFARMQENARFALKQIEGDLQLAGFWGLHQDTSGISRRAQSAVGPVGYDGSWDCENNWSIRLRLAVEGVEGGDGDWDCIEAHQDETDVLVVRRAAPDAVALGALEAGRLYLTASTDGRGELFVGANPPGGFGADARNFPLVANAYYVSYRDFPGQQEAIPTLRRSELGAGLMLDREIVQGVEEFQVQFGIDTANTGTVELYVDPDNPLLANPATTVRSARIWLLMRSINPELGLMDDNQYVMGSRTYTPDAGNANYRRMLVSRTISVRNKLLR